jgi:hypothetical protein
MWGPFVALSDQGGFRTRIGGSQPINRPVRRIATPKSSKSFCYVASCPHPRANRSIQHALPFSVESLQRLALHCLDYSSVQREASAGSGGHAAQMTLAATEFPYLYEIS